MGLQIQDDIARFFGLLHNGIRDLERKAAGRSDVDRLVMGCIKIELLQLVRGLRERYRIPYEYEGSYELKETSRDEDLSF